MKKLPVISHTLDHLRKYTFTVDSIEVGYFTVSNFGTTIVLDRLFIKQQYRNKRYGTILMQQLCMMFYKQIIWLYVTKDNAIAITLYLKFNFEIDQSYEDANLYRMKRNKNLKKI